ncbi:hypothetical protein JMJ77_0006290 [Colletotrichum scovillei]|uniref:Uncharacterized protein n=1 Tax=Colletotrichum scovillei TaxID=1209932 RepID=A0A9P7RIE1_9PEZI|nr:hypothetical protein JMJ77_0006290 [Colletotrichum scovillei]KAG7077527.1 hypothetical protein JMJ76_0014773 [Colletotrichum scovillei]KAG7084594.1 hypothetical protein JMJ78_0010027 [Colletotrichum scovillei]
MYTHSDSGPTWCPPSPTPSTPRTLPLAVLRGTYLDRFAGLEEPSLLHVFPRKNRSNELRHAHL